MGIRQATGQQMTLEVGTAYGEDEIIRATIGVTGRIPTDYELDLDEELTITISSADGEVIAAGTATVDRATPIPHRGDVSWTERRHRASFDAEQG